MDTLNPHTDHKAQTETEAERHNRIAWEAERVAEAFADVAAGRLVDSATVKRWIDRGRV
jgi:predicted transcriptional regulator